MNQAGNAIMIAIAGVVIVPCVAIALWGVCACVTKAVTGFIEELTNENAPQRA